MAPTIYDFLRALLAPADRLAALPEMRAATDGTGHPRLCRTARFAEAEIEWQGVRWLLCMPLIPAAVPAIERAAARMRGLRSPWLAEYRLLREAMRYEDSAGTTHRADLVLQQLPGIAFDEALACVTRERLCKALDALGEELGRLRLTHGNLKEENLRWHDGLLMPIRWHYVRTEPGGDAETFAALRRRIEIAGTDHDDRLHDTAAPYGMPADQLTGHLWVGHLFEQLVCVADREGFGFVDAANRPVIPPQYLWAGDFHEGRAPVQTAEGMGLIDKQGKYVLPPRFEIVNYRPELSIAYVREEGHWSRYDYEGRLLGPAPDGPEP